MTWLTNLIEALKKADASSGLAILLKKDGLARTHFISDERIIALGEVERLAALIVPNVSSEVLRSAPNPLGGKVAEGYADLKDALTRLEALGDK